MTRSSIVSTGLLLLVLSAGPYSGLAAQTRSETAGASFTGLIVDREGVGIPDASIQIESNDRQWKVSSDRNGEFKVALPFASYSVTSPAAPEPDPNISVKGYYANDKAQRGRSVQAAIVLEIPSGYHVNANRPLGKYAIPTTLKIEAPQGVTVGPVTYPRAIVRKLKATNNESLAVYEGRAILRFNLTVPANYQGGEVVLKARLRYQSCNDEVCFPPKNEDVDIGIGVVGAGDRVQRVNGWAFGGK